MIIHLTKLVPELLYRYNCVIIPGFGGFVATSVPSHLQEDRGAMHPPSKRIAFNQNLRENDGLLGYALSQKLNVSYDEAMALLESEIALLGEHLEKYRNFEFKHTGTFYLNQEDSLLFVPYLNQNFLLDSYGFAPVKVRPILKETTWQTPKKQIHKIDSPQRSKPVSKVSGNNVKRIAWIPAIAASITLLAAAAFVLNEWYRSEKTTSTDAIAQMSILPDSHFNGPSDLEIVDELFPSHQETLSNPEENHEANEQVEMAISLQNEAVNAEIDKKNAPEIVTSSVKPSFESKELPEKRNEPQEVKTGKSIRLAYAVVCMQTRDEKEAQQLLRRLESRQYEAGILTTFKPGWHVVYAQKLYTKNAAQTFATMVEKNENIKTEIVEHIIP